MPRPKGSKNKPKNVKATVDFAAQITEKQSAKEAAAAEIESITANIDALKADLKTKKAELNLSIRKSPESKPKRSRLKPKQRNPQRKLKQRTC